jgi:hypothetical protein
MNQYGTNGLLEVLGKTAVSILMIAVVHAEGVPTPQAPEMRDAATHEQLVLKLRTAEQNDPMQKMNLSKGPDPSKVNRPESLLANSDILCFGGAAVLVPKRAILQLPKKLADRLQYQAGSKFVSWADFYAANRGWVTTVEVSRGQAEGNLKLEDETQERIVKSTNLVIATYLTGPISVLPPKVPDEKTTETSKPATASKTADSATPQIPSKP